MSSSSSSSPSQDIKIDGIQSNRYGSANGSSRSDASSIEPSCDKMLKSKESKLNTGKNIQHAPIYSCNSPSLPFLPIFLLFFFILDPLILLLIFSHRT